MQQEHATVVRYCIIVQFQLVLAMAVRQADGTTPNHA